MADGQMKASVTSLLDCSRGIAWPSSVRTARRSVKSDNERDPHPYLPRSVRRPRDYRETAGAKSEEGEGNGRSVCAEYAGLHAQYKGWDNEQLHREVMLSLIHI